MIGQGEFRIPQTGEGWRHYKDKGDGSSLYMVVGLSRDADGIINVIYTPYSWNLAVFPPLYNQRLERFLQDVENGKPRFKFEKGYHGEQTSCRYIKPFTR
jgi:hypothetical protein